MSVAEASAIQRTVETSRLLPVQPRTPRKSTVTLTAALVFAGTALLTLHFTRSMAGAMVMPGGWTMSMMWMMMPGQTWFANALMFLTMWQAMMVAMMLPSSLPMLLLYRRAAAFRGEAKLGFCTWLVAGGYFGAWFFFGVVSYALGMCLAHSAMISPAVSRSIPFASGGALVVAGLFQLTPWEFACLKHCRDPLSIVAKHLDGGWRGALDLGLHHGIFCAGCCWALMLVQMTLGLMNISVMIAVAALIALEKLLPSGEKIAQWMGVVAMVGGLTISVRSLF